MANSKSPLSIFLLWKNEFDGALVYAKEIYKTYTRDVEDPLNRGIGIPVYFVNDHQDFNSIFSVSKAAKNIVILFVDDYLVVDSEWENTINKLLDVIDPLNQDLVISLAFTKNYLNFSNKLDKRNFLRLVDFNDHKTKLQYLIFNLTHEICRLLYGVKRISEVNSISTSSSPIKLFISHAKEDGFIVAKQINDFISNDTPLDSFIDTNDITPGHDFENEIICNIDGSVLLVIQSDKYASREWCRKEIIIAKKFNRPIIVLNALQKGEDRSFPYMSNVRTIRLDGEINLIDVITKTLIETLKFKYQELYLKYFIESHKIDAKNIEVLSYPPELLTLLNLGNIDTQDIVYPDPPLSDEELAILKLFRNDLQFLTPTLIPLFISKKLESDENNLLSELRIGFSISENSDIKKYGFSYVHLMDYMNELARYFLVIGCELIYGGSVYYKHEFNFVNSLFNLAKTHNKANKEVFQKITNYITSESFDKLEIAEKASLSKVATFKKVSSWDLSELPSHMNIALRNALNLTKLRIEMNNHIDVRIILGGKAKNFTGLFPGVLEEAFLAIRTNKPVFIIGAFGGVSKILIDCLQKKISIDEYKANFDFTEENIELTRIYNLFLGRNNIDSINYDVIFDTLSTMGIEGLKNGLSSKENERLFVSSNIVEIITLVFKGLSTYKKGSEK